MTALAAQYRPLVEPLDAPEFQFLIAIGDAEAEVLALPPGRLALLGGSPAVPDPARAEADPARLTSSDDRAAAMSESRRLGVQVTINFASVIYKAGMWLAGQGVSVVCSGALVHLHDRGVLIATHARRHVLDRQAQGLGAGRRRPLHVRHRSRRP